MKIIQILEVTNRSGEMDKTMVMGLDADGRIYKLQVTGKTRMGRTAFKWVPLSVENPNSEQ